MICYKDMSWCSAINCKKSSTCDRYFKPEDLQAAHNWWGRDDPPICFVIEPEKNMDCYEFEEIVV